MSAVPASGGSSSLLVGTATSPQLSSFVPAGSHPSVRKYRNMRLRHWICDSFAMRVRPPRSAHSFPNRSEPQGVKLATSRELQPSGVLEVRDVLEALPRSAPLEADRRAQLTREDPPGMFGIPVRLPGRVEYDDVEREAEVVIALPALRHRDDVLFPHGG